MPGCDSQRNGCELPEFVEDSLGAASEIARKYAGNVTARVKDADPNQVLTDADTAISRLLTDRVERSFAAHNVIDEETGTAGRGSRYTWVIDQVDGTSNFAAGLPHYGVMIGLLDGATPIAGGIALPAFGEIYIAEARSGATCNGAPIHAAPDGDLANQIISYGIDVHPDRPDITTAECAQLAQLLLAGPYKLRASNSAFDVAMVASGKYGAFLTKSSRIWDNVAPHIVIEEAGGRWTQFDGRPADYRDPLAKAAENFTFCGASQQTFAQIQRSIRAMDAAAP